VRRAATAALALVVLLLTPAGALAHATLEGTRPARDAQVARAPGQVVLRFDETVDASLGAVQVYNSAGHTVQVGTAFHPDGDGPRVAVRLPGSLPDGGYTVTYRVISADSHPISGGFSFTVGSGAAAGARSVESLLAGQQASRATTTAFSAVRAIEYAAIAVGLGSLLFLLICWRPGLREARREGEEWDAAGAAYAARARRVLVVAAVAGLLAALAAIVLEGAVGGGTSVSAALKWAVIADVLGTRFGTVCGVAALLWLGVGAWTLAGAAFAPLVAPLAALAFLPALSGHAAAQSPVGLMFVANVVHVLSVSAWLGGIAALVLVLRTATRRVAVEDRMRLLAAVVARFSALAGFAFALLLASGVTQAIVEVDGFSALPQTAFGRAVLIKLTLFAVLIVVGWFNRSKLVPALREAGDVPLRAGVLLRDTLRIELGLGAVVLGVTGALAGYAPATVGASGPVSREASVGPAHLELTADPARIGRNQVHLYLFDHHSGAQFTQAKEVRVTAALPGKGIAAIPLDVRRAGPGHAIGSGTLGVAGDWRLTVTVRTSAFDEYVTHLTLPIR
jgi:copper transport protein